MDDTTVWMLVAGALFVGFMLGRQSAPRGPAPPPYVPDADALARVRPLYLAGDKIQAIKKYRELTGAGLADSKSAVETIPK